jgi:hypothetical protein
LFVLFAQASFRFANVTHADFRSVVIGEHKPLLHPSAVSALAVWRNFIVTGGQDGVIRVECRHWQGFECCCCCSN